MAIAQDFRNAMVTAGQLGEGVLISAAKLVPIDVQNDIWVWRICFLGFEIPGPMDNISIDVLMDGTIAPLDIQKRIDCGWPTPDVQVAQIESDKSDAQIVDEFVANLNPERRHAGQEVELEGKLVPLAGSSPIQKTGLYYQFVTEQGVELACVPPGGWPIRLDKPLSVSGILLGYRNLELDRGESWDGLELHPGIKFTSIGVIKKK